jgi:hypothetical protein
VRGARVVVVGIPLLVLFGLWLMAEAVAGQLGRAERRLASAAVRWIR